MMNLKYLKNNKNSQYGFFKNKLCQANLISFLDRITGILGKKNKFSVSWVS